MNPDLAPLLPGPSDRIDAAASALQRGADALHRNSDAVQARTARFTHETRLYVQREPLKAVLIAAAAGAALMALVGGLARMRGPH